jgi:hypothetical protein
MAAVRPEIFLASNNNRFMDTATEKQAPPQDAGKPGERKFFPVGAIAFFVFLVILSLLFWYGIYFLMIERT